MADLKEVKQDLKNKRRGGFYWKEDVPFVSVTTVLKIPDKPALRYWFGQQVYRAMVLNPSMSEQEALAAPYQTSKSAMSRGTTVHSIVEAYKHTQEHIDNIPEDFRGYARAFYKFIGDYGVSIVVRERTVFSKKYKVGGTLDLLAIILSDDLPYVIDIKTGKDIYEEAFVQTATYRAMLTEEGVKTEGIAVLLLREDGEYDFKKRTEPDVLDEYFELFLHYKRAWEIKNRNMLLKMKYSATPAFKLL